VRLRSVERIVEISQAVNGGFKYMKWFGSCVLFWLECETLTS